jgi:hypothetical protein
MTDLLLRAEQSYISSQIRKSGVSVGADSREWYRENKTVQSKVYRLAQDALNKTNCCLLLINGMACATRLQSIQMKLSNRQALTLSRFNLSDLRFSLLTSRFNTLTP